MDIIKIQKKFAGFIQKYKYAVLVLLVGIVLMITPIGKSKESFQNNEPVKIKEEIQADAALEEILNQIAGAGEVKVFLTEDISGEIVFQTDSKLSNSEENSNSQIDTVTVTDSDRNEYGLIKQRTSPVYRGAIIVCQGADSAYVRLAIVEAVSKVTGLSSDRISVLKMK